ncbi:hypothetical protein V8C44DRAFT_263466 [Trichoderma aethiopicum]
MPTPNKTLPSTHWQSLNDHPSPQNHHLSTFLSTINKNPLINHASEILGSPASMSTAFSAGHYWCCFELTTTSSSSDDSFLIARIRLPQHPENKHSDDEEEYLMQCEVATMAFLVETIKSIPMPKLYAYEPPSSTRAADVGAAYMLIQGFYGNTLQDVNLNIYNLPITTQEHIYAQWTSFQTELSTITFPQIGSIAHFSKKTGPTIGPMSTSPLEHLPTPGPFKATHEYFAAIADGFIAEALQKQRHSSSPTEYDNDDTNGTQQSNTRYALLGPLIFKAIVHNTPLYKSTRTRFPLVHMDMGTQNLLVDDDYNIIAVIDWEFAQSAPWEVFHYPMPLAITTSDLKTAERLHDTEHLAHRNASRQVAARLLYRQQFQEAERRLGEKGDALEYSIADVLGGKASRIYGLVEKISYFTGMEEELTYEIVRLGYGLTGSEAEQLIVKIEEEFRTENSDYVR